MASKYFGKLARFLIEMRPDYAVFDDHSRCVLTIFNRRGQTRRNPPIGRYLFNIDKYFMYIFTHRRGIGNSLYLKNKQKPKWPNNNKNKKKKRNNKPSILRYGRR